MVHILHLQDVSAVEVSTSLELTTSEVLSHCTTLWILDCVRYVWHIILLFQSQDFMEESSIMEELGVIADVREACPPTSDGDTVLELQSNHPSKPPSPVRYCYISFLSAWLCPFTDPLHHCSPPGAPAQEEHSDNHLWPTSELHSSYQSPCALYLISMYPVLYLYWICFSSAVTQTLHTVQRKPHGQVGNDFLLQSEEQEEKEKEEGEEEEKEEDEEEERNSIVVGLQAKNQSASAVKDNSGIAERTLTSKNSAGSVEDTSELHTPSTDRAHHLASIGDTRTLNDSLDSSSPGRGGGGGGGRGGGGGGGGGDRGREQLGSAPGVSQSTYTVPLQDSLTEHTLKVVTERVKRMNSQ